MHTQPPTTSSDGLVLLLALGSWFVHRRTRTRRQQAQRT
jgi:hypothetical protein